MFLFHFFHLFWLFEFTLSKKLGGKYKALIEREVREERAESVLFPDVSQVPDIRSMLINNF